jgi:hypothetical protein
MLNAHMMAAAAMGAIIASDNQSQCLSAESNVSCANCTLVKEQLHLALLELKSARTIISLLQDDINKVNTKEATNIPNSSLSHELSGYEQARDKWIPVVHSLNKKKKTPIATSRNTEPFTSSNRFSPLSNLNVNQADEVSPTSSSEWSSSAKSMGKTTIQPSAGNKIPTIIKERVMNGNIKKPLSTVMN